MNKNIKVNAAILIIGNEILSGRTQDTNTSTLAIWLNSIGVKVEEVRIIPDIEKVKLIEQKGQSVDLEKLSFENSKVYDLFSKGNTIGIFQFESSGMREFLKKLKPTVLEDLIAMNALYRPGPMSNIDDFISRKHGEKKIIYPHSLMEPILNETYGIIVNQEQVMQIAHEIAGFTLAEADIM